jgi:serine/threonine protein phosphatase PrpC
MRHDAQHAVGGTTVQGRRFTNEDLLHVNFTPSHKMFAVLDGHNGVQAATFVEARLQETFARHYVPGTSDSGVRTALQKTFEQIESELTDIQEASGTCIAAAVLTSSSVCAANVGDSHVLLTKSAGVTLLTTEHRPGDPLERERIEAAGGKVVRVSYSMDLDDPGIDRIHPGGLAVSRVLGGAQHKKIVGIVSPVPDIFCTNTELDGEDDYLILASDGVFEVMSNDELAELARANVSHTLAHHRTVFAQELACPSNLTTVRSSDESKYTVGQLVDLPLANVSGFVERIDLGLLHIRQIPGSLVPYLSNGEDASGALTAWSLSVACQNVVDECLRRGSADNLSMLCVTRHSRKVKKIQKKM